VTLLGYDLPGGTSAATRTDPWLQQLEIAIDAPRVGDPDGGGWTPTSALPLEGFAAALPGLAEPWRFSLVDEPVACEVSATHARFTEAQVIESGQVVAGRFLEPAELDWYRFRARKGEAFWIEAVGERAGRAMDLDLAILDAKGTVLVKLGDTTPPKTAPAACPLDTLDPTGVWTAPADGDYALVVRDLYGPVLHGVDRTYWLRVGPRTEAMRVVAIPGGGLSIPRGGRKELPLVVVRQGGHAASIKVRAEYLPPGLSARETTIPAKSLTGKLTLAAAADAPDWAGPIRLVAESTVGGKTRVDPLAAAAVVGDPKGKTVRLSDGIAAAIVGGPAGKGKPRTP
jgi:hypothetical protein